jgi:hypothetical protein
MGFSESKILPLLLHPRPWKRRRVGDGGVEAEVATIEEPKLDDRKVQGATK